MHTTLLTLTTAISSPLFPLASRQDAAGTGPFGQGHLPAFTEPDAIPVPAPPVPAGKAVYNPAQNKRGVPFNNVEYIQQFWGAGTRPIGSIIGIRGFRVVLRIFSLY
jgi:hypothetical protein